MLIAFVSFVLFFIKFELTSVSFSFDIAINPSLMLIFVRIF
jgi:hypothetical protein